MNIGIELLPLKKMPRRRKDYAVSHTVSSNNSGKTGRHNGTERHKENKEKPQQRNAANARERARMRVLSRAFCRLKTTLPWVPADTKLSKLDTLRLATTYIGHLRSVLIDDSSNFTPSTTNVSCRPLSMSWPFMFSNGKNNHGENTSVEQGPCGDYHHHHAELPDSSDAGSYLNDMDVDSFMEL